MTKNASSSRMAAVMISEQIRTLHLIRRLVKAVTVLLCIAFLLTAMLSVTKTLPFFYRVSEDSVTVRPGDTLWLIAEENMGDYPYGIRSYVAEIRRLNGMGHSSEIVSGTTLVLPIYSYLLS